MTPSQIINLGSAGAGVLGTLALYKGSFAYEQMAMWANAELIAAISGRNRRRQYFQRSGLVLISISFLLQGIAQFV